MQVLIVLVEAAGAVVSRDDLIQRCWEGRAVSEDAINRCIGQLRRLAKSCDEPCFTIECIPRVGYRLLVATLQGAPHPVEAHWPERQVPGVLYGLLLVQQSAFLLAYGGYNSEGLPIPWAIQYSGPLLAMIGLALSLRPRQPAVPNNLPGPWSLVARGGAAMTNSVQNPNTKP